MEFDEIGTIQIYVNKETGKYAIEFIRLDDETNYGGLWQKTRSVPKDEIDKIYEILEKHTKLYTEEEWSKNLSKKD